MMKYEYTLLRITHDEKDHSMMMRYRNRDLHLIFIQFIGYLSRLCALILFPLIMMFAFSVSRIINNIYYVHSIFCSGPSDDNDDDDDDDNDREVMVLRFVLIRYIMHGVGDMATTRQIR